MSDFYGADTAFPSAQLGATPPSAGSYWNDPAKLAAFWQFLTAGPKAQPAGGPHTAPEMPGAASDVGMLQPPSTPAPAGAGSDAGMLLPPASALPGILQPGAGPVPFGGEAVPPYGLSDKNTPLTVQPTADHSATTPVGDQPNPKTKGYDFPTNLPKGDPASATTPGAPPSSVLGRLMGGDWNTANMLLRLAAGFGGARSFGEGIGKASGNLAGAIPGMQQQQMTMAGLNSTAQFLMSKGIEANSAAAMAMNPEMLKTYLPILSGTGNRNINGIWFDATGKPLADMRSIMSPWSLQTVETPEGEKGSVWAQPDTGRTRAIETEPAQQQQHPLARQPEAAQKQIWMRQSKDGGRYHDPETNRTLIKRGGRAFFEDTGEPVGG